MDPIADMFTTIRNNASVGKQQAVVSYSKIKAGILDLLKAKGIVAGYEIVTEENLRTIKIDILEDSGKMHLRRISKPGRRVFVKSKDIKAPLSGLGFTIISTPKGLLLGSEAKKIGLGGEIICEVW